MTVGRSTILVSSYAKLNVMESVRKATLAIVAVDGHKIVKVRVLVRGGTAGKSANDKT